VRVAVGGRVTVWVAGISVGAEQAESAARNARKAVLRIA
jgi:hypothetical protein